MLVIVSGLLAVVGFMASFGVQHSAMIGTQSMTGSQFAEASPSNWGRYIQEGAGMSVDWSDGPPLQVAYLIPLAGLVLLGLGFRHFSSGSKTSARAVYVVGATGALLLVGCWWAFLKYYGSDDGTPGIGSYLCGLGFALATWRGVSAATSLVDVGSPSGDHRLWLSVRTYVNEAIGKLGPGRKALRLAPLFIAAGAILPSLMRGTFPSGDVVLWNIAAAVSAVTLGLVFAASGSLRLKVVAPLMVAGIGLSWALDLMWYRTGYGIVDWQWARQDLLLLAAVFASGAAAGRLSALRNATEDVDWRLRAGAMALGIIAVAAVIWITQVIMWSYYAAEVGGTVDWFSTAESVLPDWTVGLAYALFLALEMRPLGITRRPAAVGGTMDAVVGVMSPGVVSAEAVSSGSGADSPSRSQEAVSIPPRAQRLIARLNLSRRYLLVGGFTILFVAVGITAAATIRIVPPLTADPDANRVVLEQAGLEAAVIVYDNSAPPQDTPLSQSPSAGSIALRGTRVTVHVAGYEPVKMPSLMNAEAREAEDRLEATGFVDVRVVDEEDDRVLYGEIDSGVVINQEPKAGTVTNLSERVRLGVAVAPDERAPSVPVESSREYREIEKAIRGKLAGSVRWTIGTVVSTGREALVSVDLESPSASYRGVYYVKYEGPTRPYWSVAGEPHDDGYGRFTGVNYLPGEWGTERLQDTFIDLAASQ